MKNEKVKTLKKKLDKKTGNPDLEFPFILIQDENGRWHDFDTVGKDTPEVEVDPRVRYPGGNHYIYYAGIDSSELKAWVRDHPEICASHTYAVVGK